MSSCSWCNGYDLAGLGLGLGLGLETGNGYFFFFFSFLKSDKHLCLALLG